MKDYRLLGDPELVTRCLEGEEKAWEEILERYKRLIYSIPFKYSLSEEDAADVFQTICARLMQNLPTIKDKSKLVSWLITTTSRECWKLVRERKHERLTIGELREVEEGPGPTDPSVLPEQWVGDLEEQSQLRRALRRLDERCRRLLHYIFYEHRTVSYKDIGQALHMPESSIGPTRARCLAKLKKLLAQLRRMS